MFHFLIAAQPSTEGGGVNVLPLPARADRHRRRHLPLASQALTRPPSRAALSFLHSIRALAFSGELATIDLLTRWPT